MITIIGGGLVGLATAFRLANAGHKVRVFDAGNSHRATYHAGGMLAPAAEVVYRQEPLYPLMVHSAKLYPQLVADVAEHTDLPTGYRTEGTLVVAADRADATHLSELCDHQNAHGMAVDRLTVRQARDMEPALSPRLAGAVSIPGDHQIAPRVFTAALRDALENMGVEVTYEKVTAIPEDGLVILAAGLGAAELYNNVDGRGEALKLRPVYGDILRVRTPQPLVDRVIRGFVEDRPIYVIPRANGEIALGATTREDERPETRVSGMYDLLRDAIRVVPGIEECDFIQATTGARPGTPDDLPYLGRASENLIVSTGYFRHGILLTAFAADEALRMVEGREPGIDISACDIHRHESHETTEA